jgi:lipocalin
MELDKNYNYVVVGSSSDKYLWILSRTPQLEESIKQDLLTKISERGYDTTALYFVPQ